MDLEEYWQENKTFLNRVGLGAAAFLIGISFVSRSVGKELSREQGRLRAAEGRLRSLQRDGFESGALDAAETDHRELLAAADDLGRRVQFTARPGFLEAIRAANPAGYLGQVTAVRERLFPKAVRNNVSIETTLGLPESSPTRAEEIERTLEGLDALEQLLDLAVEEGVDELDKLRIRVDPDLFGKRGVGSLETTRVEFRMTGTSGPVLRALARSQGPGGRRLQLEKLAITSTRDRPDEVRAVGTIVAARVADELLASDDSTPAEGTR